MKCDPSYKVTFFIFLFLPPSYVVKYRQDFSKIKTKNKGGKNEKVKKIFFSY